MISFIILAVIIAIAVSIGSATERGVNRLFGDEDE